MKKLRVDQFIAQVDYEFGCDGCYFSGNPCGIIAIAPGDMVSMLDEKYGTCLKGHHYIKKPVKSHCNPTDLT